MEREGAARASGIQVCVAGVHMAKRAAVLRIDVEEAGRGGVQGSGGKRKCKCKAQSQRQNRKREKRNKSGRRAGRNETDDGRATQIRVTTGFNFGVRAMNAHDEM